MFIQILFVQFLILQVHSQVVIIPRLILDEVYNYNCRCVNIFQSDSPKFLFEASTICRVIMKEFITCRIVSLEQYASRVHSDCACFINTLLISKDVNKVSKF